MAVMAVEAVPVAAEAAGGGAAAGASKAGASKAGSAKAGASKASPNPTRTAADVNTGISSGQGTQASKSNPTGDALSLSEQLPKKDKGGAQAPAGGKPGAPGGKAARGAQGKGPGKAVGWAFSGSRKLLTVEFIACIVVLGMGTLLAPEGSKDGMPRAMVKGSALAGLFLVLSLVASGGKGPAKAATAVGTLVTAAYVLTSSDVHNVVAWIGAFFSKTGDVSAKNPTGTDTSVAPETPNAPGTPTGAGQGPGTGINPAPPGDFTSGDQLAKGPA
jgi:hypothetical protein